MCIHEWYLKMFLHLDRFPSAFTFSSSHIYCRLLLPHLHDVCIPIYIFTLRLPSLLLRSVSPTFTSHHPHIYLVCQLYLWYWYLKNIILYPPQLDGFPPTFTNTSSHIYQLLLSHVSFVRKVKVWEIIQAVPSFPIRRMKGESCLSATPSNVRGHQSSPTHPWTHSSAVNSDFSPLPGKRLRSPNYPRNPRFSLPPRDQRKFARTGLKPDDGVTRFPRRRASPGLIRTVSSGRGAFASLMGG